MTSDMRYISLLGDELHSFGANAASEIAVLLSNYLRRDKHSMWFVNCNESQRFVRPLCDAVEISAMFGVPVPFFDRIELIGILRSLQNECSGVVPERIEYDENQEPAREDRLYATMIVNYALEILGSHLPMPVKGFAAIAPTDIDAKLSALNWQGGAWVAGDWVDCYATALYVNQRYFGWSDRMDALFHWLEENCDAGSGLWGSYTHERWLQPVNGFYRLTRGTYAQFGRELPLPEKSIDTILTHAIDAEYFGDRLGNACNVLDVVHPLWLCLKQAPARRPDALEWIAERLPAILSCWQPEWGFPFDLSKGGRPSLQGTEMWLSIIYLMADLLGLAGEFPYRPKGVHRLEPVTLK